MSEKKQMFGYILDQFGVLHTDDAPHDGGQEKKTVELRKFPSGHINKTYYIRISRGAEPAQEYVLQSINPNVYVYPENIMRNLDTITTFFHEEAVSGTDSIEVPLFLKVDGRNCLEIGGEYWRMYPYIPEDPENTKTPFQVGLAYGRYIRMLHGATFDLLPAVDGYHDFVGYHNRLSAVMKDGSFEMFKVFRAKLDTIFTLGLPKRYIHSDAKTDNVILKPDGTFAILDLDTTMKHYAALDYGDMIRSVTTGKEKQEMLETIRLATAGFANGLNGLLTPEEVDSLFYGILWVTWELAMRYLTDCYAEERYFTNMSVEQCRDRVQQLIDQSEEFSGIKEEIKLMIEAEFVKYM